MLGPDPTVQEVWDTLTEPQQQAAYFMIGKVTADGEINIQRYPDQTLPYLTMTDLQQTVVHFLIGKAAEEREQLRHKPVEVVVSFTMGRPRD